MSVKDTKPRVGFVFLRGLNRDYEIIGQIPFPYLKKVILAVKKSMRLAMMGLTILTLLGSAIAKAEQTMGIIIPSYFGADRTQWDPVIAAAGTVPLITIASNGSGPGSAYNSDLAGVIDDCRSAGGKVIGYIWTNNGDTSQNASLPEKKAEIDNWNNWYNIDGIMFDNMPSIYYDEVDRRVSYYAELNAYCMSKNSEWITVGNPGRPTYERYLTETGIDIIGTCECSSDYDNWPVLDWQYEHDSSHFWDIVYNIPTASEMRQVLEEAQSRNVGWVYVRSPVPSSKTLTSYWDQEVSAVAAINNPVDPPVLELVDNGCPETGLHSYTLVAKGYGITTLSRFTIDGELHQVFDGDNASEWLGDGSASQAETTDSHVIFGGMRLPDLGGKVWDYETHPDGPPDQFTEETIDVESGFGTLNNYDEILGGNDAYTRIGMPSGEWETLDLMQLVVADGDGFSIDLKLLTYRPDDELTAGVHELTYLLPTLMPGDADGDGHVGAADADILAQHWLQDSDATWAMGDFNRDGKVNDVDAAMLAANWNPASVSTSAPEPGIITIMLAAVLPLAFLGRKSKSRGRMCGCDGR